MNHYSEGNICAVVVSYNPDSIIIDNVHSLLDQTGLCVIVDNGSLENEFLEGLKDNEKVDLIRLGENKGIAAALNAGLQYCIDHGFPLMLTMDQDTVLEHNAVRELLNCMNEENADSVGINWDGKAQENEHTSYLITSGNLVNVETAQIIGGYDEALFIDSVDFDFSLRLTDNGRELIKVKNARAEHHLGEQQHDKYITHSVDRYYYIYRNHFYMIRKYRKTHRKFCVRKQLALGYDLLRILAFDNQRKEKYRMLIKGYKAAKLM